MGNKLLIGWSEKDLTPEKNVRLEGQFAERISESVETRIYATSLAIDSGDEQMVICACDLVGIYSSLNTLVREMIKPRVPDLDVRKVIISATHTHTSIQYEKDETSTGMTLDVLTKYLPAGKRYVSQTPAETPDVMSDHEALHHIAAAIADSVTEAWNSRKPGYFANAFGRAAVGLCRRVGYDDSTAKMWGDANLSNFEALEGGNDSGVELLYIFDENKKLSGVVANLACPAQTVQHRKFISSDFWGKTRLLLHKKFGENIRLLSLCSAAGDQCPVDLIRWVEPHSPVDDPNIERMDVIKHKADPSMFDIEGSWKAGKRVANEIIGIYEEIDPNELQSSGIFVHEALDLQLPVRKVTLTDYNNAQKALQDFFRNSEKTEFDFYDTAAMHVHAGIVARYEYQQKHELYPIEVHIVRLGDIAIATSPFELFLDYGNQIKARSRAQQTFLIQLACDSLAYLPTKKAEDNGHYSAYVTSGITGHEGGNLLVRQTLDVIRQLWE